MKKNYSIFAIFLFSIIISCKNKNGENSDYERLENENSVSKPLENFNIEREGSESGSSRSLDPNLEDGVDFEIEDVKLNDCSEVESISEDAYEYCKKAYNSDDFDDIKSLLKKAMNSFEEAMSSADDCNCDDAYSSAEEGYTYAKRGYNSDDIEEMNSYAKKARNSAEEVLSNAEDCNN